MEENWERDFPRGETPLQVCIKRILACQVYEIDRFVTITLFVFSPSPMIKRPSNRSKPGRQQTWISDSTEKQLTIPYIMRFPPKPRLKRLCNTSSAITYHPHLHSYHLLCQYPGKGFTISNHGQSCPVFLFTPEDNGPCNFDRPKTFICLKETEPRHLGRKQRKKKPKSHQELDKSRTNNPSAA